MDEAGPADISGVFEDDGETGYLYVYNRATREVVRNLHIYDRSRKFEVHASDVRIVWSGDMNKCGVLIWGKMRGIIDVQQGRGGRVWLIDKDTPGISEGEWLSGFDK